MNMQIAKTYLAHFAPSFGRWEVLLDGCGRLAIRLTTRVGGVRCHGVRLSARPENWRDEVERAVAHLMRGPAIATCLPA